MFPDPEAMLSEVKAMGFKVCLWMNSYLGVESERFSLRPTARATY
jgi:alpha-D-xyloside xylohydrolase